VLHIAFSRDFILYALNEAEGNIGWHLVNMATLAVAMAIDLATALPIPRPALDIVEGRGYTDEVTNGYM